MALLPRGNHARNKCLDSVNHSHHVDAMDPAPIVDSRFPYIRGRGRYACVIEEQMTGTVGLEDLISKSSHRSGVRDIGDNPDHVGAFR